MFGPELACKLYENTEPPTKEAISCDAIQQESVTGAEATTHNAIQQKSVTYAEPSDDCIYASIAPKSQSKAAVAFDPKIPVTIPMTLSKLGSHVGTCHSNANDAFSQQFKVCCTELGIFFSQFRIYMRI